MYINNRDLSTLRTMHISNS